MNPSYGKPKRKQNILQNNQPHVHESLLRQSKTSFLRNCCLFIQYLRSPQSINQCVHDDGFSRNVLCALNVISVFSLHLFCTKTIIGKYSNELRVYFPLIDIITIKYKHILEITIDCKFQDGRAICI
jgi:hypothetical protein